MEIGDTLRLSALTVPDGVTLLDDLETTVLASVAQSRAEEEPVEVAAEGEEGAEPGAEGEEGESQDSSEAPAEDASDES
jgi:hypothetical protein